MQIHFTVDQLINSFQQQAKNSPGHRRFSWSTAPPLAIKMKSINAGLRACDVIDQTSPFSVLLDTNSPPLMLRWEEAKKQILRNLHVISRRDLPAWAALCVISDVNGPPSSPPRSPSVTHSSSICAARRSDEPVHTATGVEEGQRVCCCSQRVLAGMDPGEERWSAPNHAYGGKGKLSIVCFLLRCACSQVRGGTLINQWNPLCVCASTPTGRLNSAVPNPAWTYV